jgi:hypothetical protein
VGVQNQRTQDEHCEIIYRSISPEKIPDDLIIDIIDHTTRSLTDYAQRHFRRSKLTKLFCYETFDGFFIVHVTVEDVKSQVCDAFKRFQNGSQRVLTLKDDRVK